MPNKYTPYSPEQRIAAFWSKTDKSGGDNACWPWIGRKDKLGYGQTKWGKPTCRSHRISYELAHGSIPDGLRVCHRCDNPSCVNPKHLFLGTDADNNHDMIRKGREKHAVGEKHANHKLSDKEVREIRRLREEGIPQRTVAKQFGISQAQVWNIAHRLQRISA